MTIITWILSLALMVYILSLLHPVSRPYMFYSSMAACVLFLYLYAKIGLSHPGVATVGIDESTLTAEQQKRYCLPCRIYRPQGTHHCYYCDICI